MASLSGKYADDLPPQVFEALLLNTDCFIDQPEWQEIQEKVPTAWSRDRLQASILHTYAKLPAFYKSMRQLKNTSSIGASQDIIIQATYLKQALRQLNQHIEDLLLTPESGPRPAFSTGQYQLPSYSWLNDIRLSEALCIFWRTVILATRGFFYLRFADQTDWEFAEDAAGRLCNLVQRVQMLAPCGVLFSAVNLRVARLACPEDLRLWIDDVLPRIEGSMNVNLLRLAHLFDSALDILAPA
jgi:hypothetical protein